MLATIWEWLDWVLESTGMGITCALGAMAIALMLRNFWRMDTSLRELARLLSGRVVLPPHEELRPHVEGICRGRRAVIDFDDVDNIMSRDTDHRGALIWVRFLLEAPCLELSLDGEALRRTVCSRGTPPQAVAQALARLAACGADGVRCGGGWAECRVPGRWDVAELPPPQLVALLDLHAEVVGHLLATEGCGSTASPRHTAPATELSARGAAVPAPFPPPWKKQHPAVEEHPRLGPALAPAACQAPAGGGGGCGRADGHWRP